MKRRTKCLFTRRCWFFPSFFFIKTRTHQWFSLGVLQNMQGISNKVASWGAFPAQSGWYTSNFKQNPERTSVIKNVLAVTTNQPNQSNYKDRLDSIVVALVSITEAELGDFRATNISKDIKNIRRRKKCKLVKLQPKVSIVNQTAHSFPAQ